HAIEANRRIAAVGEQARFGQRRSAFVICILRASRIRGQKAAALAEAPPRDRSIGDDLGGVIIRDPALAAYTDEAVGTLWMLDAPIRGAGIADVVSTRRSDNDRCGDEPSHGSAHALAIATPPGIGTSAAIGARLGERKATNTAAAVQPSAKPRPTWA